MLKIEIAGADLMAALELIAPYMTRSFTTMSNVVGIKAKGETPPSLFTGMAGNFAWAKIDAKVEEPGTVLVNGDILRSISKTVRDNPVVIEEEDTGIKISAGPDYWVLYKSIDEDVPPAPSGPWTFIMDLPALREMVRSTRGAMSTATPHNTDAIETKRIVYEDRPEVLRTTATDGHRLFMAEREVIIKTNEGAGNIEILEGPGILLSEIAVNAIICLPEEETVEVWFDEKKTTIVFQAGNFVCGAPIVTGKFPNYEKIFQGIAEPAASSVIQASLLDKTLKKVGIVSRENTRFETRGMFEMEISGKHDSEKGQVFIEANNQGGDIRINLNGLLVRSALDAMDVETIQMDITDEKSPVVMKPVDSDHYWRGLVMPLKE